MTKLFDTNVRALRRDRAARTGPELFLYKRAFEDCLERIGLCQRRFDRALLIGCPDAAWPFGLREFASSVDVREPGSLFAQRVGGERITEDAWEPSQGEYDLVVAIGTLDTINDLPLALHLIRYAMRSNAMFIGAVSGGDSLPQLRRAMRAGDSLSGAAAPHVHPRLDASALAPILEQAGFIEHVIDVDRVPVSYRSLQGLVNDLRAMGATNVLCARPRFVGKKARQEASCSFMDAGDGKRTTETFEILHFAAWTPK